MEWWESVGIIQHRRLQYTPEISKRQLVAMAFQGIKWVSSSSVKRVFVDSIGAALPFNQNDLFEPTFYYRLYAG